MLQSVSCVVEGRSEIMENPTPEEQAYIIAKFKEEQAYQLEFVRLFGMPALFNRINNMVSAYMTVCARVGGVAQMEKSAITIEKLMDAARSGKGD